MTDQKTTHAIRSQKCTAERTRPISRSRQMHEQQTKKVKHTRDPGTTSLYLANIGSGGSWVRGHGLAVGREKETYSGILAQALLGEMSYCNDIPPKRSKDKLEPPGACHEG